jgi:putative glutamine amidotransferase
MMKKLIWILLLASFILACTSPRTAETEAPVFADGQKHIVIMHPTVNNLRTFLFLTQEGIFPLPEGYRAVGVFHESASYDYQLSAEFIREEGLEHISLLGIAPVLDTESLYRENECTPLFREIFEKAEGAIFFGGPDIPPATYGQPLSLLTVITDPNRHYLELSFLFHLLGGYQNQAFVPLLEEKPDFPILGLCLGMQTMNVATGGTMIQDIPFEIYEMTTVEEVLAADQHMRHRNYNIHYSLDRNVTPDTYHQVEITEGHLAAINHGIGHLPYVLSSHHQAASKIGQGFKVTARSMDGKVVEAIEHQKYPHVIGVQFHPEVRDLYKPESKINVRPFEPGTHSYLDLYPGEKGETFHRNFWKLIASWYSAKAQ